LKNSVGAQKVYQLHLRDESGAEKLAGTLRGVEGVIRVECTGDGVRVFAHGTEGLLSEIVSDAASYGLKDLTIAETSLETVFIQLTGRDLRE
jgi:ABC-2 type transport system ATP-binding protein